MSGAAVVLIINLIVTGLLSASFAMVAVYDRKQEAARWMAVVYGMGVVYCLTEFLLARFGAPRVAVVFSFSLFLAALLLFNVGVARKYQVPVPWRLLCAVFLFSVVACNAIQDIPRQSFTRMMAYQAPYFAMQLIGAWIVWSARSRRWLDNALMLLLAASSLQFLSKPFLSDLLGGTGASAQSYLATTYALISQSMGTVTAVATALLFLVILARDVIADVTTLSQTDSLSGLLNRGGFERCANTVLQQEARKGRPVSLVICDLDYFKTINDTFGHASGDKVIKAFASFLSRTAADHHIAGRIGGEEFAIILPGANLAAARLFAECTRTAFSTLPIEGLPDGLRFTASFGVSECAPGDDLSELLSRADKALYAAKKDGRDCVRTAASPVETRRGHRSA